RRVMRPLNTLASATNAAVLLLHHLGKQSEEAQAGVRAYRGRGASSSGASARLVLLLTPDAGEPERVTLACAKSKGERFPDTIMRLDQAARWFRATDERPARMPTNYELLVEAVCAAGRAMTRREIDNALEGKVKKATITRDLRAAVECGDLVKSRHGLYEAMANAQILETLQAIESKKGGHGQYEAAANAQML